jgi:hypothetical protein
MYCLFCVVLCVVRVCICVLYDCHRVATQLQLNISYHICIQQDATLRSLFKSETALHVSGGISTHGQERIQLYLQHLVFVTPLLLSAAIVEELEPV